MNVQCASLAQWCFACLYLTGLDEVVHEMEALLHTTAHSYQAMVTKDENLPMVRCVVIIASMSEQQETSAGDGRPCSFRGSW